MPFDMFDQASLGNIEEWTDEELLERYREMKAETVPDDSAVGPDDRPGIIIEDEVVRRGLMPDREDIVPEPLRNIANHPAENPVSHQPDTSF